MMSEKKKDKKVVLKINPSLYKLRVIYSCAYLFLEKAYIFLEGDPKKEILVRIKAKDGNDPREIADKFLNELLNASLRYQIAKENRKIREYIVGSALISVSEERKDFSEPCVCGDERVKNRHVALNWGQRNNKSASSTPAEKDKKIDDPLGIAIPWEEKYGKES